MKITVNRLFNYSSLWCATYYNSELKNSFVDLRNFKNFTNNSAIPHIDPDTFASSYVNKPMKILNDFINRKDVYTAALQNGICEAELSPLLTSFADYYSTHWCSNLEMGVILSDIEKEHKHITDLLPIFLRFAYSHRSSKESLVKTRSIIQDFVHNYHSKSFQDARHVKRKIHMHTGPTNSGKTYHAMQCYLKAQSGIYAAPLRTLAYETFVRTNNEGIDCDMFTGEQKIYKNNADKPSAHISCTTEMVPTDMAMYEVAVIDEIQMIADVQRGGAWTRALFGLCCEELHLCGHESAISIVKSLLESTGEELTVHSYERLTPLTLLPTHLNSNCLQLRPGDCIISFSRQKLHQTKAKIEEKTNMKCSIIYGGLPPSVRLEQIKLFNDPDSEYQVAVASDAIGLGVNLNIKRIIFDDLYKMLHNEMTRITPELVMQVSGRAGRFMSLYPAGEVTCFHANHYPLLKYLFNAKIPDIAKAIISPPPQIWAELDYIMPNYDLVQLLQFMNMGLSKSYRYEFFVRHDLEKMSFLYKKIGLPSLTSLSLLECFVNLKKPFVCNIAEQIFTMFAEGKVLTYEDLLFICSWPRPPPAYAQSLELYERISDVCDLYLWLNQRNPKFFPDRLRVQELKEDISKTIGETLCRPCINDGTDVLYIPDSVYCENLDKYLTETALKNL
ncbi:ATP-dependent RNA helicase SUPV3L1, mitochondrial [Oopsacas minuta]|uniref:RNA helicase n=1 Tax=Oopsacas minuta TaxID=111878 RepID=A0AAV7KFZ6_9METZ|nr:ATP-dependent RNA helicase SUPV3L1, mitochondrial [Oopsacas minuta]